MLARHIGQVRSRLNHVDTQSSQNMCYTHRHIDRYIYTQAHHHIQKYIRRPALVMEVISAEFRDALVDGTETVQVTLLRRTLVSSA